MAPNIELSSSDTLLHSTTTTTKTGKAAFNVKDVVYRFLASSPTAVADLEALAAQATDQIASFTATTPTFQLSSFGPTGLVTLDLLSRAGLLSAIPVVFIDTLHHFDETYELLDRVRARYPAMQLHVYKPTGCQTRADFEAKFGEKLWESVPSKFAYYTKAEPRDRAMRELGVTAYINGRRKSQGNQRGELAFLDFDQELSITRVQPLFNWTFEQVWGYLVHHSVPYNALHDQGFKSVGDVMNTSAVGDEDDERSGRWKGSSQSECGLHLSPSQLALLGLPSPTTIAAIDASMVSVGGH